MIVTEDSPKDPLIPKTHQDGESSHPPPPPYSPITANPYENISHFPQPNLVVAAPRQSPGVRFIKAFVVAVLIWFLACALTESIFGLKHYRHPNRHRQGEWDIPLPANQIDRCVDEAGWRRGHNSDRTTYFPYYATTSFYLPADSDLMYMVAHGDLSSGHFEVVESTAHDINTVEVDVTVRYHSTKLLDTANICLLKRDGNQHGIGIFTPEHWGKRSPRDQLQFEIIMRLPPSTEGSPLQINGLETTLPLFSHKLGDLLDKVKFQSLSLTSTDMPIIIQSIFADNALIHTDNGPISGSFKTSSKLELFTANAPINVDVELENNSTRFTDLRMKTVNSPIDAEVKLISESSSGGNFSISAINANGRISVSIPESPVDSTLQLQATTANSPVRVALHPAYEGLFSLSSTPYSNVTVEIREVDDPSGKDRKRAIIPTNDRPGSLDGRVWWGTKEDKTESWVKLKTLNSDARLIL